jgi:threonine aldolase
MRSFGSDNHAGVHPDVLAALVAANADHVIAYGEDPYTARALELFRAHFGPDTETFLVGTGSAANVLSLQAVLRPYESVVCAATAHINTDECGAPEHFMGVKLIDIGTGDGKLTPELIEARAYGWGNEHHTQPKAVSITQTTEVGTCYSAAEIAAIADWVHARDMLLHVDGARIANAAATLGVGLAAAVAGADVLSFGGTKNGLLGGEAVVFLRPGLAGGFKYLRKQAMQLTSKMRFVGAQFAALLSDDLWLRNASHANAMARRLADGVRGLPGIAITQPVQANAVFATVPAAAVPGLQAAYPFYLWEADSSEARWMTSYDTTEADVDGFVAAIRAAVSGVGAGLPG